MWPAAEKVIDALVKWPLAAEPNETGFSLANETNQSFYSVLEKDPDRARRFGRAMTFFTTGEGYSLRHLTDGYDWASYCIKALRALIPALKPGARVLISEFVMPPPGVMPNNLERELRGVDVTMLETGNARERDFGEWIRIFEQADSRFVFKGTRLAALESSSTDLAYRIDLELDLPDNPRNTFTTPPTTRKRKAVEEAATKTKTTATTKDKDNDRKSIPKATRSGSRSGLGPGSGPNKTLRLERSVSVHEEGEQSSQASSENSKDSDNKEFPLSLRKKGSTLVTPTTTTRSMDSDDDFMTDVSSREEDFLDMQDSEDESLGEDFGDDFGDSFSYDKDLVQKSKKPYEVEFKVLSPADIDRDQNSQITEVSSILGLPPESAGILLRFARWNREKLIESYMDRSEEILEEAGLGHSFEANPRTEVVPGFMCEICCEDGDDLETHYLSQKIKEEGEAARIQCPQDHCHRIVDSKSLNLLVTDELKDRYKTLLTRTYVDDKDNLKWCPAPNCEFAIDCGVKARDLNKIVPTVHCACKHSFCFGCGLNDHQPPPCSLVKMWLKKCEDDSETANWISANTKECPKCLSTIEKNGGCNHMTCRKCKHEFCWMCMGLWSEHGTSWYNCNRYTEKSGSDARDAQARSRASLERYLHYYNRYANHEQSAKLDKDLYLKTEKKMTSLQSQSGMSWIEVQFLDTASQALQQCRQTLKWTYAFAYYLARNNLTEIFEDNQKDLEMAVESLSEMFEKPIAELAELKVDILDKTAYCNKRRVILLSDTAENLKQNEWKFNVEL
ncbi:ariadne homolog [Talaromyces pinophilus]|uniref:RBR-type E3 ubiquitin transferase n=1 Tax=Talaromyces pinophilus TaxID=128442 RepID=A0A510NWH7_TALPI|nr:ariadne homolog [Talaromyces pinophilus]